MAQVAVRKPTRTRLRVWPCALAILFVAPIAWLSYSIRTAGRVLIASEDEIRSVVDPLLTWTPPSPPAGENAYDGFVRLGKALERQRHEWRNFYLVERRWDGYDEAKLRGFRVAVEQKEEFVPELRRLASLPVGVPPLVDGLPQLDDVPSLMAISDFLAMRQVIRCQEGTVACGDATLDNHRVMRAISKMPLPQPVSHVSGLVDRKVKQGELGVDSLRRLLAEMPPPEWEDSDYANRLRIELWRKVPMVTDLGFFRANGAGAWPGVRLEGGWLPSENAKLLSDVFAEHLRNSWKPYMERSERAITLLDQWASRIPRDAGSRTGGWTDRLRDSQTRLLLLTTPNAQGRAAAHIAVRGSTLGFESHRVRTDGELFRTKLALAIFEMEFGELPDSLQELIDEGLLSQLPIDFFSGDSLRYDRSRREVWSVGYNGIDDSHSKPEHATMDILAHVPRRSNAEERPPTA